MSKLLTAESVTAGHPDKICDQISDTLLDKFIGPDKNSRVAIETFGTHGCIVVGGEVTSRANVDVKSTVASVYKNIGYNDSPKIEVKINKQSPDISVGVDNEGAGDQGIMYGYATNETPAYLPLPVVLVNKIASQLEYLRRHDDRFSWLRPDGKAQVTVQGKKVVSVLVSCQHAEDIEQKKIKQLITEHLIYPIVKSRDLEVFVNPTGRFVIGGFQADTGLTGRKIMVDTYGGLIPHGGGCFSGKDPTKVDRSGAYMARFVAKNIVANGYATKCLVSVAYAIGKKEPLMVEINTFRPGNDSDIRKRVLKNFDFSPRGIINTLDLQRPIYAQTAVYGHFGKPNLPWEKIVDI